MCRYVPKNKKNQNFVYKNWKYEKLLYIATKINSMVEKINLTSYNSRALTFFVTNNNKLKKVFHDENDWNKIISLVNEKFSYNQEQYNHLKEKFNKSNNYDSSIKSNY